MALLKQKPESTFWTWASYVRAPFVVPIAFATLSFFSCAFSLFSFLRLPAIDNFIIYNWGRVTCWLSGIRVIFQGEENLPKGGCLLTFSHSSYFDIPIMYGVIRKSFRYGAKSELFQTPFLGMVLKSMGALPIHRGKKAEVLKLYEKSVQRIEKGESFALAPEGRRQKEAGIGEFKTGPFIFAVQAKALVVPIVIKGSLEILPRSGFVEANSRWSREVIVSVLPAIDPMSADGDIDLLRDKTRESMRLSYESLELSHQAPVFS